MRKTLMRGEARGRSREQGNKIFLRKEKNEERKRNRCGRDDSFESVAVIVEDDESD